MVLVTVSTNPRFYLSENRIRAIFDEVVVYALNTKQGPLQPGDTDILINDSKTDPDIDILIQVECRDFPDRIAKQAESLTSIKDLTEKAYYITRTGGGISVPDKINVVVYIKYINVVHASKSKKTNVEMTESAVIERIRIRCGFASN